MSTIAGIYRFDGRPIQSDMVRRLGTSRQTNCIDSQFQDSFVGMSYRAFHTTIESLEEVQPLVSDERILCWDGRLDNRQELTSLLRDNLNGETTDIALVYAAYRKWPTDFLLRLIGDFALALWDPKLKTLMLARDPAGPRPLYYHLDEHRIIWCSELPALLDHVAIPLEPNDEYVADYLTRLPDPGLTPYKHIQAVQPGSCLTVTGATVQVRRCWYIDPNKRISYPSDADYEQHFRELFREAVRVRLRVNGPVWVQLSGGLDSSAIACMGTEILGSGDAEASRVETVSHVYETSTSSDERD